MNWNLIWTRGMVSPRLWLPIVPLAVLIISIACATTDDEPPATAAASAPAAEMSASAPASQPSQPTTAAAPRAATSSAVDLMELFSDVCPCVDGSGPVV